MFFAILRLAGIRQGDFAMLRLFSPMVCPSMMSASVSCRY